MSRFVWDDDDVVIISTPESEQPASITLDEAATNIQVEWEQH